MVSLHNITGLTSSTIAITALVANLPGASRLHNLRLAMLIAIVAIVVLIPVEEMPLAAYLRGWIGDLSIPTLTLLMLTLLTRLSSRKVSGEKTNKTLYILVVLAGLALYPMALGMGYWDPYRLGFGNSWFLGGLFLLALAACFYQSSTMAMVIALAVLAWSADWYESRNLWDYLLDPLLVVYSIYRLLSLSMKAINKCPPH
jgi:hypothetical protein